MSDAVLRNTSAGLEITFEADGVGLNADGAVTVTITRADGTVLVTAAATTQVAGSPGKYRYTLAPQANLDILTLAWSGTFSAAPQTLTSKVEIVGAFYYATSTFKLRAGMTAKPAADVVAARRWIEGLIERECGTSFVARYRRERLSGSGRDSLMLSDYVQRVVAVTVGGVAYTAAELADLVVENGMLYRNTLGSFTAGRQNVYVTYDAGWSATPPPDLTDAAIVAAKYHLLEDPSGISPRALSLTNEFGNIRYSTPGENRPTGLPDVDAVIVAWRDRVRVPAIA